jgi:hypothetical protein
MFGIYFGIAGLLMIAIVGLVAGYLEKKSGNIA